MGNLKKSDDVRHVSFTNLTIIPNLIKGVDIDVENLVNGQVKFSKLPESFKSNVNIS